MRVSEHIEHHARKAKRHIQSRPRLQLLMAVFLTLISLSVLYYGAERYSVAHQDLDSPLRCMKLSFSGNMQRCEAAILANYSARAIEDLGIICEQELFGNMTVPCQPYYDMLSERYYAAALLERGISVWEPTRNISGPRIHYRTLSAISELHVVCNQVLVNTNMEREMIKIEEQVNDVCVLIATTAEGSITSLPFNLSSAHVPR